MLSVWSIDTVKLNEVISKLITLLTNIWLKLCSRCSYWLDITDDKA